MYTRNCTALTKAASHDDIIHVVHSSLRDQIAPEGHVLKSPFLEISDWKRLSLHPFSKRMINVTLQTTVTLMTCICCTLMDICIKPYQAYFYTASHDSDGVLWYHFGCLCVHLSVHLSYIRPYFCFRMITWVNFNGFSLNLVCALISWSSGLGLLMGRFCQVLTELSAHNTSVFSFLDNNLGKSQWIFTKLGMCINWYESWWNTACHCCKGEFDERF